MTDKQQKPMSDERLAEIRERFRRMTPPFQIATVYDAEAGFDLLAEVERSRAREAAAMEIVRAVAESPDTVTLTYVPKPFDKFVVVPLPARDKARALLGDHE